MKSMFDGCNSLTVTYMPLFNTENVTNLKYMFLNCKSLILLDLRSFNAKNVTDQANDLYVE